MTALRLAQISGVLGLPVLMICCSSGWAEESISEAFFAKSPAFSAGDQPAKAWAACPEVRAMADALPSTEARVDLSVTGRLTSIRTDGALWYFTLCSLPDIRIMCVAYQENGMKVGDTVLIKGGYTRVDPDHALLDPCLAADVDQH